MSTKWRQVFASLIVSIIVLANVGEVRAVELGLVLAIDASPSVDAGEYQLQMAGYAAAFRDREMLRAIDSIDIAGMAVTVVLWGGPRDHVTVVDWTIIRDRSSARAFAGYWNGCRGRYRPAARRSATRLPTQSIASILIISALGAGLSMCPATAAPIPVISLRSGAIVRLRRGITVNGLTILNDEGGLDLYYLWNVVGGPQSFVEIANDYHDFEEAILCNLIREIRGAPSVQLEPTERYFDLAMD